MPRQPQPTPNVGKNSGSAALGGGWSGRPLVSPTLAVLPPLAYACALAATSMLVYSHLTDASLPGCGLQSACSQISAHPLGSLGGMSRGVASLREGVAFLDVVSAKQLKIAKHEAWMPTSVVASGFFAAMLVAAVLLAWRVLIGTRRDGRRIAEKHTPQAERSSQASSPTPLPLPLGGGEETDVRCLTSARRVRLLSRLGAVGSLVYLGTIVVANLPCRYCLAAHASNLVAWVCVEILTMHIRRNSLTGNSKVASAARGSQSKQTSPQPSPSSQPAPGRSSGGSWTPLVAGAAAFALVLGVLGFMDSIKRGRDLAKSQAEQQQSQAQMLAQAQKAKDTAAQQAQQQAGQPAGQAAPTAKDKPIDWGTKGFQSRWRLGPEKAVVRIVLFSSYQCHQCKRLEGEAMALQAQNPDKVSVSAFHFPLCAQCNPNMNGQCPQGNSCWAARAAETAAIIAGASAALEGKDQWTAGNDAFWKMHAWLFARGGSFTDASFPGDLQGMGYDPQQFTRIMQTPQTLALVTDDIAKAMALGINGTPMVWVNGIELKGWEAPKALENATKAILAAAPPALDATADKPVTASEKYVADWRDERVRAVPPEKTIHALGATDAPVQVLVYGDFFEPNTAKVDALVRGWLSAGADGKPGRNVRYTFRHFPGNSSCNPGVQRQIPGLEQSCLAAKAAEAAFTLGGDEAYWKMHSWLLANGKGFSAETLKAAAPTLGLDAAALMSAIDSPAVAAALQEDVQAAAAMGVGQIPCVFINGKWVPRWLREGDDVLGRIVDEAGKK